MCFQLIESVLISQDCPRYNRLVTLAHELDVARRAAEAAGRLALEYQGKGVQSETKLDLSPVTIADRECERLISRTLQDAFPDDGLLGEEGAATESKSGRRWIIDPIDGTRDFLRGIPVWSVLIGLEDGPDCTVGVCHLPARGETFSAARGVGAFRNDAPIRASAISDPTQAVLFVNALNEMTHLPVGLLEWMEQFWSFRCFGGCYDAMLVASGRGDAWIEPSAKPWDLAALKAIAVEAGAVFFNLEGDASIHRGHAVITCPGLEPELRRFLNAPRP
jgi:histidinol phosphatase-like enzyme (inositol monophosphatase family)